MRITCPTCETSYNLADGSLRAGGRKVRCTRCGTTWHARPDAPPPDELAAESEWSAIEAATPTPPPGPTEDDWREALSDAEPRRTVGGGPLPFDDEVDGDVAPEAGEGDDASTFIDPDDPPAGGDPDAPPPTDADAGDPDRASGAMVPVAATDPASDAGEASVPTIDAEPAGFTGRRKPAARTRSQHATRTRGHLGTRIVSMAVLTVAACAMVALVAGSLFARDAVVRRFPDLAGLYALVGLEVNLRGLAFSDLKTYREVDGATPVLVVEGTIANVTDRVRPVPRLRFGLRSTSGREVYAWTMDPAVPTLDPGETSPFKSRLPVPPEAATDVQVRFTDRKGT
ncbi:MAG TPA: zinc-ribbon domain-containing protein [Methylomirabilota bacterium]|nr:zinc-ribbon domain-containing protein [Methylomirabilota bacterium]